MESGRQQQPDKKQLLQQQQLQLQKQLHQQQQQQKLLKQQQQHQQFLQQQPHLQQQQQLSQIQNQQQLLQQTQAQPQTEQQLHLLQQTQSQPQTQQQQQQMLQQTQPQTQRKQNLLTQQILQQEHLKQQQLLLERQQKQEQALLELLQLQDDNGEEDIQEELLIAQQRPQLIQQQQQLHLKQQHRQQQEQQQELQALQQKHAQSQLMHQLQHVQQLQQQPQLIQQTQQLIAQDLQQSHSVQKSQLIQPQVVEQSQHVQQSHFVQQPHQQQQTQYTSISTQQQIIKQPPHSQQLLQQQLQQILSTNKNYPQRIVVLGNQPQQQQLVTQQQQSVTQQQQSVIQQQKSVTQQQVVAQQPQNIVTNNTTVQQQLLAQQMQCVVVTGNTQQQPQQIQRVVVTSTSQQQQQMQRVFVGTTGQQQQLLQQQLQQIHDAVESGTSSQQQSQQMQGVVVSTIGQQQQQQIQQIQHLVVPSTNSQQKSQQIQHVIVSTAGQQLQQVQHVVIPGTTSQPHSHQVQRVIVSTAGQQQQQQIQQIQHIVVPSTNSQQHSQQMQCVVVTSASNQQQQLAQQIQPSTQRIMIGQLKPSQQTQQSSSQGDILSQLHQQDIQRSITVKQQQQQQQQRVVITGQQQLFKLPQQQQQSPHQIVLQPQLVQQILQPKQQKQQQQQRLVATHQKQQQQQLVQQIQQIPVIQQKCVVIAPQNQQNITVSSDESLLKELQKKQLYQQLHIKTSQNNVQHQIDTEPQQEQQQEQQKNQDKQQQQQNKKQEQKMEQLDRSGVVIGQLQRQTRSEPEEIKQQLKLQQLQRQKLQECLLKELRKQQQQKQQQQEQKQVNEQQLQNKRHQQQLREQVLLQQHLKQQRQKQQIEQQLVLRQKASKESRVSIIIDDNQEQELQCNMEKINHCKKSPVPEATFSITEAVAMQLFRIINKDHTDSSVEIDEEKLVALSTSSDEDDDDEAIRKQRNLFLETERLVHERYDALSKALGPKCLDYYRKILMTWLDGQLSQEKFETEVQKVMYSTCTLAESVRDSSSNSENKSVTVTDSPTSATITSNTFISSTQDLLVASTPKTARVKSTSKKSASTLKETRSKIKAMAHVASSTNKEAEEEKEEEKTATNIKISKTNDKENNLPLHNAFMDSLAAWMPLSSQQTKRRLARARGVTETGCPLRLYTYSDVPQARGSSDHWYPDIPGSLANWYWPDQLSFSEPVKNEGEKPFTREKEKNNSTNAMATAVLLRPPSHTTLPLLLRMAADTEAARATQQKQWLERHSVNLGMDMIKKLQWERLKQKKKLIAMVQLQDVHKKLLDQLKVRIHELDLQKHQITLWLRHLQTRIIKRRFQVLILFRIQKEDFRIKMRKYFDRSWQERPDYQVRRKLLLESAENMNVDDSDEEMESDEDHQNRILRQNLERIEQIRKNKGQYPHQLKTTSTFNIPRQTSRGEQLKLASLMIKLLCDRKWYHEIRQMLQAINLEQQQVNKYTDRIRELCHMHCPCGESNVRSCRYRKQMRQFQKQLRTNELNAIEKKTKIEIDNEAEKEIVTIEESEKPETVVVENKKAKAKKKKIVTTKVKKTKTVKKKATTKTECKGSGSDANKNVTDGDTTNTTTSNTTITKHKTISNATTINVTGSSEASISTNTTENAAPRILDFIDLVEAEEKQDMGTECELFQDESSSSTRSNVADTTHRRQQSARQKDRKCTVNVVAAATRAAQAALAASRRTQKRRSEAASVVAAATVSAPIDLAIMDDDNGRRASELMPPPPPPKNINPRKPSIGARYLKQQQLLLDRHKQLERMRREEEERQNQTRNERQEEQNNELLTESENVATASSSQSLSLQPTRLRRCDGLSENISQDLNIEFHSDKYDKFNNLGRGIGGKKEGRQQNNYHFYYGDADYYSSDDEMIELSSNEPPFPPLMHDLRMDQFPQSSIRVPDVTRTTSVVKTHPLSTPSSSVDFNVGAFEHGQKNVQLINKRKREINEPLHRELCDKQLKVIEQPGSRQEDTHQQKNIDKSVTGSDQRMEKAESFEQHQIRASQERQSVKEIASVELQLAERKEFVNKSSEVEGKLDRGQSGAEPNLEHKQTQFNENKIKQVVVSVTKRKSHSRRQSKSASNRKRRQQKRRIKPEIILEEKLQNQKNKESETTVDTEKLRLVKWNNECSVMEENQQIENETKRVVKSSRVITNHSQCSKDLENNKQLLTDRFEQLVSVIDSGKHNCIIMQNLLNKYLELVVGLPPEHHLQQMVYLKEQVGPLKNISIQPESIADIEIEMLKQTLSLSTSQVDHEETRTTLEELHNLLLKIRHQRAKVQQAFNISDVDEKYSGEISAEGVHFSISTVVYEDLMFWFGSSSNNSESNDDNKQWMSKISEMIRQYLSSSRSQKSVCPTRVEMQQFGRKGQKRLKQDETGDCQPSQGKRIKLSLSESQGIMESKMVEECDRRPSQEILQLNQQKQLNQLSRIERISELRQQEQKLKQEKVQIDRQKQREQDKKKRLLKQPHASKCVWALGKFTLSSKQYNEQFPLREQLMHKIVGNKSASRLFDYELQQFTDDIMVVIKKKTPKLAYGQALNLSPFVIKRGSALWWFKIGMLRRISPLVMKVCERSDEQSTQITTVRITDQLQLTRPQIRKVGATVVAKDRKEIAPALSIVEEKNELRTFIQPHLLRMMTKTEDIWLNQLQIKLEELNKKKKLHWNTMIEKEQQQVKLLLQYYHQQHNSKCRGQNQLEMPTSLIFSPVHGQEVAVGQVQEARRDAPVVQDLQPHSLAISQERKQLTSSMLIGDNQFNYKPMLVVADPTWEVSKRWKELEVMRKAHEERWKCRLRQWSELDWINRKFGGEVYDRLLKSQGYDARAQQKIKSPAALKQLSCQSQKLQPDLTEKQYVASTAKLHDERLVFVDQGRQGLQMPRLSVMPKVSTIIGTIEKEQWKQEEQNKSIKWIFQKLMYLLHNHRVVLQRQMDRINVHYSCEQNIEPSVSLTLSQQPSTNLTAQRPSTSKQKLSTSSVLLTPQLPEQQSERPLVTMSKQLAIQLQQEKRQLVEQRLSEVFSQMKPLMELWQYSLRFPTHWLHRQLDEIEEIKKREESKRSGRQRLRQKRQNDGTLVPITTDATSKELPWLQLKQIYEYLEWWQQRVCKLANEFAMVMRREYTTALLKTIVSRTEERPPSTYSVLLKLQQPSSLSSGQRLTYSVLLKLKQPLTSESSPQPLLRYSSSLILQQTANSTTPSKYSVLLILQQPTTSTQVSSSHSMLSAPQHLLTKKKKLSVLLTPQESSMFENSKFPCTPVIITPHNLLTSKHQSSVSPVILTPQQSSMIDDQRSTSSVIRRTLQTQISSVIASPSATVVSEPNKELRRQLNNDQQLTENDEEQLSDENVENEGCSENVNSTTTKRPGSPGSVHICSKRLRSKSPYPQTDKSTSDIVVPDENTIIILDSDDDDECEGINNPDRVVNSSIDSSDSTSESSMSDDSSRQPVTNMSVQLSDKSPLKIKFIKTKPLISTVKLPKSMTEPIIQNAVAVKTKETQNNKYKDTIKKIKKNHRDVEKNQINKILSLTVTDRKMATAQSAAVSTEIVNGLPADVTEFCGKSTVDKSPGALSVGRELIKVSIIKCAPSMEGLAVGDDDFVPEAEKSVKMMMYVTMNRSTGAADIDRLTAIVSKLTEATIAAARKIPVIVGKTAEVPESGPPPVAPPLSARIAESVEKPITANRTVRRRNNRIGTKGSLGVVRTNQRNRGRLTVPKRETTVRRRRRHLLRTVTVDTRGPAMPSFRDHGFADGTTERAVHERFVTTIMAMTAAQSIASYVPSRRTRNLFDPAIVKEVCEEFSKTGPAVANNENPPKPGNKVDASTNTPIPLPYVMDRLEKIAKCGSRCGNEHLRSGCARTDSAPLVAAVRFAKALRVTDTASSSTPAVKSPGQIASQKAAEPASVTPVEASVSDEGDRDGVRLTETGKRSASTAFAATPSSLQPAPKTKVQNRSKSASRPSANAVVVEGRSKRSGSVASKTIVEEETRTVTITRTTCPTVPSPMDVTADACKLVASTCEKFIRAMVTERLKKAGRGAGTFEMRRREEHAAAVAVDEDIRPTPEYCWTSTIAPTKTAAAAAAVVTGNDKNVKSLLPSTQQQLQRRPTRVGEIVCDEKPNESIVKTVKTTVETRTYTVHDDDVEWRPSSTVAATTTIDGTSARTRGLVRNEIRGKPVVLSQPPPPKETVARTRPVTASKLRSPDARIRQWHRNGVVSATAAMEASSCETPRPVSSLPMTAGRRGFFVERGRPLLRPEFHRRRPFGTLVATCAMAAAEATAANDAAYAYFDEERDSADQPQLAAEDEYTDDWGGCYFGDPEMLPPVSRFNDFLANGRRGPPPPSETTSTQRPPTDVETDWSSDDDNDVPPVVLRLRQQLLDEVVRQQEVCKQHEREAEQRVQNYQKKMTPDEYYREFLRLQNGAQTCSESSDDSRRNLVSW